MSKKWILPILALAAIFIVGCQTTGEAKKPPVMPPAIGWQLVGSNVVYTQAGNVGVGTNSPTGKLDVAGQAKFSQDILLNDVLIQGLNYPTGKAFHVEGDIDSGKGYFIQSQPVALLREDGALVLTGVLGAGVQIGGTDGTDAKFYVAPNGKVLIRDLVDMSDLSASNKDIVCVNSLGTLYRGNETSC